ncbi:aldo/keto reductase [Turicibacter sp. HGF1]|uniref:aldo/keto reductase n=1 Tax=Turicibacter sp. HGF1 TaxID=910310 RepID=UPI000A06201D
MARSGIKREDLFITSKLNNFDHGYEENLAAFDKTMKGLELDYLDLYLIHWLISLCIVIIDKKQMLGLGKHLKSSTLLGKFVPLVLVIFFLTLLRSY